MNKLLKKGQFLAILLILLLVQNASAQHFITDIAYRDQVHRNFVARQAITMNRTAPLFNVFNQPLTTEETEAMEFLYAYMPLSDLADYDGDFFLRQVRTSFAARDYFSWGKTVPEDIFRHFVLVYRVNNENLDNARWVFFDELKERLQGLSMYEAALEVNHWCHEKVAYRPSDGRTSAPLATIKTALGRCGEESTFTVTALRSVGIPARQCYTPRWAHTDDNHAWVEVWVNGKWYFLGACEPDPELNMGWFAIPSTRTMMVHSNAFGKYNQNEEVTLATNLFSRVNMLPNYTTTQKITIKVLDNQQKPIKNATVKFKLYNYAEYYPIAVQKTDENGVAQVTTGLGDLLIWASNGNYYNYEKMDVRKSTTLSIILNKTAGKEYNEELTIVPPYGTDNVVVADEQKTALNIQRLQFEDSLRNAYICTFKTEKDSLLIKNVNITPIQIGDLLHKSEGNYAEIIKLLNNNNHEQEGLFLYDFMTSLSDKDLRDLNADIVQQHLTLYKPEKYPFDVYVKGILSPRIANEGIRTWRNDLRIKMTKELGKDIDSQSIVKWIHTNIQIDNEANYFNCPISPMGVYDLRLADAHSRNIFFVAACRALDLPAYLDNATNQLFVYENLRWNNISFENSKPAFKTGKLTIDYQGDGEIIPTYWTHYTIAKYENGDFVTFDYENDPRVANFPFTLELETGYYMISTGNRYSDGTTLSRLEFFNINAGDNIHKNLIIRDLIERKENYGTIATDFQLSFNGSPTFVNELTKNNTFLLCFIDPTREPTKHLLNDIAARKNAFDNSNLPMIFVVPSDKNSPDFNFAQWELPAHSICLEDTNNEWFNNIVTSTNQYFRDNYPLVFLIDNQGKIFFKTEGYRIGTGDLILKTLRANQ